MTKEKTTEQFKQEVLTLGKGEYHLVSDYTTSTTKVKIYHDVCGTTYEVLPKYFLKGSRCRICMNRKVAVANTLSYTDFYKNKIDFAC